MTHFDLVVIGAGSGNSIVDERFADRSVAIVEEGKFGGTCINVGCIPTKMFVYPAELAGSGAVAHRLGVDLEREKVHWPEIRDRIFGRIDAIEADGRAYRVERNDNVTVYEQRVHFTGPKSLETADGTSITGKQIVVASGSRPVLPDVPGVSADAVDDPGSRLHTSDTVMRIDTLPERIVIVGGGYVAAEFAHIFGSYGSQVTLVGRSSLLLRTLDRDISEAFTAQAKEQWDVRLGQTLTGIDVADDEVTVHATGPDAARRSWSADAVLLATGRRPNTDRLHPEAAKLDVLDDGRLAVDEYQRLLSGGKPRAGMWGLGDVSSDHMLKHVANHEARTVQHNLLHPKRPRPSDHRFVPFAVFTHPQIASVGVTEAQASDRGLDYVAVRQDYGSVAYGWAMEDTTGFVKLVADRRKGTLLGAHIIGHEASMIIQPLIQAMSFGLSAHDMARGQYWIHPALPEVVENALLALPAP